VIRQLPSLDNIKQTWQVPNVAFLRTRPYLLQVSAIAVWDPETEEIYCTSTAGKHHCLGLTSSGVCTVESFETFKAHLVLQQPLQTTNLAVANYQLVVGGGGSSQRCYIS